MVLMFLVFSLDICNYFYYYLGFGIDDLTFK